MTGKSVIIVGGGNEGLDIFEKAKKLGLTILNVNSPATYRREFGKYVDQAILTDLDDLSTVVSTATVWLGSLKDRNSVCGIVTLSEAGLVATAHLAKALALPGVEPRTVHLLKDKAAMRAHLNKAGISPVRSAVAVDPGEVLRLQSAWQSPVVVKPVAGSRSNNVLTIECSRDIVNLPANAFSGPMLVEEYLDGPEISVEAFSFQGRHVIFALTSKETNANHIEMGHSIPFEADPATIAAVQGLTTNFLDCVGLSNGPSHTEIKLTSNGPKIIESHNRVGGDRINELVHLTTGVDLRTLTIQWFCGLTNAVAPPAFPLRAAAIRFYGNGADGQITHSRDRLGHVICTADTPAEARTQCVLKARQRSFGNCRRQGGDAV